CSWADELAKPANDYVDKNGIRITTEYDTNDEGKKVEVSLTQCVFDLGQVIGRPQITLVPRDTPKSVLEHTVSEHKKWSKFGKERGNNEGPDCDTATVGDSVVTARDKVRLSVAPVHNLCLISMRCTEREPIVEQNIKTE
ncbi:hypothetical protein J3R83DRAFT_7677, partial [Lanmaoa asiatica]